MASRRLQLLRTALSISLIGLLVAPPAWAGPKGERVVSGKADVSRKGKRTKIKTGDRSIIEWDSFDIGKDEKVRFAQPGKKSRVLNRVMSTDMTRIDGKLKGNGQIYIVNPEGVFFGGEAVVDVGRLVAVGGSLTNDDFLTGVDRFDELHGAVENHGLLSGDDIALVGRSVANHGRIESPDGGILMVAGDEVWLAEHDSHVLVRLEGPPSEGDAPAVLNTGAIDAGRGRARLAAGDAMGLAIHNQGEIRARRIALQATGEGARVDVAGRLDASNLGNNGKGGRVDVSGDWVLLHDLDIDASGRQGGGRVRLGGDVAGDDSEIPRALGTYVASDVTVRADATRDGDGGRIVVWGDQVARVFGDLSARGGAEGGDGGFVETSGLEALDIGGAPDLSAANGEGGLWLIDPVEIEIVSGTGSLDDASSATPTIPGDAALFESDSGNATVGNQVIIDSLSGGTDVVVTTQLFGAEGNSAGNITVNAPIVIDDPEASGTVSLTLKAANSIKLNEAIAGDESLGINLQLLANNNSLMPFVDTAAPPDSIRPDGVVQPELGQSKNINNNDEFERGNVIINASVDTAGGGVLMQGVNVEINEQITTDGGLAVVVGLNPRSGSAQLRKGVDGDVTLNAGIDARTSDLGDLGGSITVIARGEAQLASGAVLATNGASSLSFDGGVTDVQGQIIAESGQVAVGRSDGSIGNIPLDRTETLTIEGGVTTVGGRVIGEGKTLTVGGNGVTTTSLLTPEGANVDFNVSSADIAGRLDAGEGDLTLSVADGIEIEEGSVLTGSTIKLSSGSNPSSDDKSNQIGLKIKGVVELRGDEIRLTAGDGEGGKEVASISLPEAILHANGNPLEAPEQIHLVQDADVNSANLPTTSQIGGPGTDLTGVEYTVRSVTGEVTVAAGDGGNFAGADLTLDASTAIDLEDVIEPENLTIRSAGGLTLSDVALDESDDSTVLLINSARPTDQLRVNSGTDGTGDIDFNGVVTLSGQDLRLRAGDGPTGQNDARVHISKAGSDLSFDDGVNPLETFVLRQDAKIRDKDIPEPSQFRGGAGVAGLAYSLRSDGSQVTVDNASKIAETDLTILANGPIELNEDITIRSVELGKTGDFIVGPDLLDRIIYSDLGDRSITLSAAVGGAGTLSFVENVVVRGDQIELVAGNNGNSGSGVVNARNDGGSPRFQVADTADPPADGFQFLFRQDSPIENDSLPKTDQFDVQFPDRYAIRSDEAGVSLSGFQDIPDFGDIILDGESVSIESNDGGLIDLGGGRNVEFRANVVRLQSFLGDDPPPGAYKDARIDASNPDLILADFDPDVETYDFDARSGVPDEISFRQEAKIDATDLPVADAYRFGSLGGDDDNGPVPFTIASRQGKIDLTGLDPGQVDGSSLTLRLTPFDSDNRNAKNVDNRTVVFDGADLELNSLLVEAAGALTLDDNTTIDAEQLITLQVGTAGQGGNLDFDSDVVLESQTIRFEAGDGPTTNPGRPRSRVNAGGTNLRLNFVQTDDAIPTGFVVQQDKKLTQDNLPVSDQFFVGEGIGPLVQGVRNLNAYVAESREASVKLDSIEDLNAQSLVVAASSFDRENATVKIIDRDGDLNFVTLLTGLEERDISLEGRQIVLRSDGPDGQVIANDARLSLNGELGPNSAPRLVRIKQPGTIQELNGLSLVPGLDQFGSLPVFSTYQLVSTESDIIVGSAMAPSLEFTNLRLIADDGTAKLKIDRSDDEDDATQLVSNFELASLEVRADKIVLNTPIIEGGVSSIRTVGQQIYDADEIIIAKDSDLEGRSVDFQGRVDGAQEGAQTLSVFAFGSVGFREDVGMSSPLQGLQVTYDLSPQFVNTTEFGRSDDDRSIVVQVTNDIQLNPGGRNKAAEEASFYKANGDLTLRSTEGGTIKLGRGEVLTAVGDLTIEAEGGTARLSDLNALDTLSVTADHIELVRRDDGELRVPSGARAKDGGVDFNANEIIFEFDDIRVAGPRKKLPAFGIPNANHPPDFLVDAPKGQRFALASLSPRGDALTKSDFFRNSNGRVLDLHPAGPSRSDLATALPGRMPRPRGKLPVESGIPPHEDLIEVGVDVRSVTRKENREWLDGAAVYDDSGAVRRVARVTSRRIEADAMARSVDLYERLFGPDRANAEQIRHVLQGAVDSYLETTLTQRIVGFEFRRFVKNRPSSLFAAYQALEDLDALFRAHRNSGLSPAEFQRIQAGWLEDIQPEGIGLDELAEAIFPSRYVRGSDILDIFGQ